MRDLQTTPQLADHLSPKDALRAHVDHLPLDKQYEFVLTALNLIAQRPSSSSSPSAVGNRASYQLALQNRKRSAAH